MADFYEWNNPNSIARVSLENFWKVAMHRVETHPEKLPFKAADGMIVLNWLHGLMDRKPSELEGEKWNK